MIMKENEEGPDSYTVKLETTFRIITNDKDSHLVTKELGIVPTKYRQKGDKTNLDFSQSVVTAQFGFWEISKISISEDPSLSEHIDYFRRLLEDKLSLIENLIKVKGFECFFYVLVVSEDSVGGVELTNTELNFISSISDRFIYRFATSVSL